MKHLTLQNINIIKAWLFLSYRKTGVGLHCDRVHINFATWKQHEPNFTTIGVLLCCT